MKRFVKSITLSLLAVFIFYSVVLAAWEFLFPTAVADTSMATRTYYPVLLGYGGQTMVDAGKIASNGTDTNMQIGASSIKYMMSTTNVTAVIPMLPAGGVVQADLLTGYSPEQMAFAIITGSGGYVTVADNASLEVANNFTLSMSGYVDTASGSSKDLVHKVASFRTYVLASGNITSAILSNATAGDTLRPDGAGDETNLTPSAGANWQCVSDANDATYVSTASATYVRDLYACANSAHTEVIANVTIYFRIMAFGGGANTKGTPHFKISGVTYNGTEQAEAVGAWTTRSEVFATSPATGVAWAWSEINAMQIGISLKDIGGGTARCADEWIIVTYYPEAETVSVNATGISSGVRTVITTADTANLTISVYNESGALIDSDTVALGGASAPDTTNNWLWMQNNVMPYCDNITLSVNGVQQLWLAPNVMLSGATVPDRSLNSHPGTITWGSNSGVTLSYGEMESYESYYATANATVGFEMPSASMPSSWFASGENVSALPFYDAFSAVAAQTGIAVQVLYSFGIIGVAFGSFLGLVVFTRSALIAYIAMVMVFGFGASMTVIPGWIVFALIIVGLGIMYLYRQVA